MNPTSLHHRVQQIQLLLAEKNLNALLVSSIPNIIYLTGYSGFSTEEREAFLLITQNEQYIFTDARYIDAVKEEVSHFTLMQIGGSISFRKVLVQLAEGKNIQTIGFEPNNLSVAEYLAFKKIATWKPADYIVEELREIKTSDEIAAIEKACAIGDKAFYDLLPAIKIGMTEKQVAAILEVSMREQGAEPSFRTIAAFGKNAAIPHHMTGNETLSGKTGQYILLDFGAKVDNYCSDMTRTVFFGTPSNEQVTIYNTVKNAQQEAIDLLISKCHPERDSGSPTKQQNQDSDLRQNDIAAKEVDEAARNYIIAAGFPPIPHSLGHGIGIQVHELPSLSPRSGDVLKEGMVFSVEPGIYLPAGRQALPESGGVRIEDLVAIEKKGVRLLTLSSKDMLVL